MDGTELTQHEKETKLADEFDRFASENEESIHTYYPKSAKLMNDIIINKTEMKPIQINTKNYVRNTRNVAIAGNYTGNTGRNAENIGNSRNLTGNVMNVRVAGTQEIKTVGDYAGENVVKVIKCYNYKGTKDYVRQCTHKKQCDFMVKLTPAGSDTKNDVGPSYDTDALSEVPNYNTHNDDMFNPFAPERQHSEQPIRINDAYVEETNDSNIGYSIYKH
ncbi:hypothetical protein Tco_0706857 [Tanacetum coccineum]|uniref:FLYWCH-type domain-containing protein n=1 Tax=Tanacetum coccineum TaxID=301880 RepID=A0ABQ4Y9K7_9ASTR